MPKIKPPEADAPEEDIALIKHDLNVAGRKIQELETTLAAAVSDNAELLLRVQELESQLEEKSLEMARLKAGKVE